MAGLAARHGIAAEAIAGRRLGSGGVAPMPQESEQGLLARARISNFSASDFRSKLERKAKEALEQANAHDPEYQPSHLDITELAYRMGEKMAQGLESPEQQSLATRLLKERFPEAATPRKIAVAKGVGTGAPEGSNVVPEKTESTGKYGDQAEGPLEEEGLDAMIKARAERAPRIAKKGTQETIASSLDKMEELERMMGEEGANKAELKRMYDSNQRDFLAALSAELTLAKQQSDRPAGRHGLPESDSNRETSDRPDVYDRDQGAPKKRWTDFAGSGRGTLEGKTEQPGALDVEEGKNVQAAMDVIANSPEMLNKYMSRYSGTVRSKIQKALDKLGITGDEQPLERGRLLGQISTAATIEGSKTREALSRLSERSREKLFGAGTDPTVDRPAGVSDPDKLEGYIAMMEKIAAGTAPFQGRVKGGPSQQRRSLGEALDMLEEAGMNEREARMVIANPNLAANIASQFRELQASKPKRSEEERVKRDPGKLSVIEGIIQGRGGKGKSNPNTEAAKAGIPGVQQPLGTESTPSGKQTPGRVISSLSELGPSGSEAHDRKVAEAREKYLQEHPEERQRDLGQLPTRSSVDVAVEGLIADASAKKINVGGKLDTIRNHVRAGRMTDVEGRNAETRMIDAALRQYKNTYSSETKKFAKEREPRELDSVKRLAAAYAEAEKLKAMLDQRDFAGKPHPAKGDLEKLGYKPRRYQKSVEELIDENQVDRTRLANYTAKTGDVKDVLLYTVASARDLYREMLTRIRYLESQVDPKLMKIYEQVKGEKGIAQATDALVREVQRREAEQSAGPKQKKAVAAARAKDVERAEQSKAAGAAGTLKAGTSPLPAIFTPYPGGRGKAIVTATGGSEQGVPAPVGREISGPLRNVVEATVGRRKAKRKGKTPQQERRRDIEVIKQGVKRSSKFGQSVLESTEGLPVP